VRITASLFGMQRVYGYLSSFDNQSMLYMVDSVLKMLDTIVCWMRQGDCLLNDNTSSIDFGNDLINQFYTSITGYSHSES
jgi:hypothetical protein